MADDDKKLLLNMEIFATGWHVPAVGDPREWTASDLEAIVAVWKQGIAVPVHLKVGHTSDEFTALVAAKLGVPVETVRGEGPAGGGVISLGIMTDLRFDAERGVLVADWEVPEAVVDLIAAGYTDVSSEMLVDFEGHPFVLSAVALLGAERPAVDGLKGLEDVAVLMERQPALVAKFAMDGHRVKRQIKPDPDGDMDKLEKVNKAFADIIKGKRSALALGRVWGQIRSRWEALLSGGRFEEDNDMDIAKLVERLKLQGDAGEAEIIARLDQMMSVIGAIAEAVGLGGGEEEEPPEDMGLSQLTDKVKELLAKANEKPAEKLEEKAAFKEREKTLKMQEARIAVLEKDKRMAAFRQVTTSFTAVTGTSDALAEELLNLEDKIGADAKDTQIERWKHTQGLAEKAGVLSRIGTAREGGNTDEFDQAVRAYADKEDKTYGEALAHFKDTKPSEFQEWRDAARNGDDA